MEMQKTVVPIFYAVDENYLPFLAVSVESLKKNASKKYAYALYVLHSGLKSQEDADTVRGLAEDGFSIEFVDVSEKLQSVSGALVLRDYYSLTTYYRIFIINMFPEYEKAIYLDSDTIVLGDISEFYETELADNLLGAIPDGLIQTTPIFQSYVFSALGIPKDDYFNAGVLLMNLKELRSFDFFNKFVTLLGKYKFAVAQDQDYLNVLCFGRVKLLAEEWDAMPVGNYQGKEPPKLIHYNLTQKPWRHRNIKYEEYFWEYAKISVFYDKILAVRDSFEAIGSDTEKKDRACEEHLLALAVGEIENERNYYRTFVKEN